MAIAPFDASTAVTFDLPHGHVRLPDESRGVLIPVSAILEVCRPENAAVAATLAQAIGEVIGRAVKDQLADLNETVRGAPLEAIVDYLDGCWAVAGLGRLRFERWGSALVVVVDDVPFGEVGDVMVGGLLEAALSEAADTEVRAVRLHREGARARFLVTGSAGAERVRGWLGEGVPWGEALVRVHGEDRPAAGGDA